jgi:actin-related protein
MKISDILRVIANNMDHPEGGAPDPRIQNPAGLIDVTVQTGDQIDHDSGDKTASGNDKSPEDLFLPPLQQKQELLKKAVGVENVYDDGTPAEKYEEEKTQEYQETAAPQDLVTSIKQLGGVPMAAIQELSNDEPLDD